MSARLLVALVALAAVAGLLAGRSGGPPPDVAGTVRVVHVVDGDTVDVRTPDGRRERVRYIGIDTPESVKPGTPVQCFAKAASAANARLVAGRAVRLTLGAEHRDRYGRLLAYVRRDGVFVNAVLVARGYARTLAIAPNTAYAKRFSVLQNRARALGRGLWSAC